jgi:hypothetical protein
MATVATFVDAAPSDVFAILANGWYYSGWVVGSSHVRAVETDWPAVGSRLHHASGVWPATLRDETQVAEVVINHRLVLIARGRPLGEARVEITLDPHGAGTLVTLVETPVKGPGSWLNNPLSEGILHRRNVEALARLAAMAEDRTQPR